MVVLILVGDLTLVPGNLSSVSEDLAARNRLRVKGVVK